MIVHNDPQGSDAWLESRRGAITGSRAKDARDKLKNGLPSAKALLYARDVARERCGGKAGAVFVTAAMRMGTDQEMFANAAYEALTGEMVIEAGFITTDDCKYGCSVDGLVGADGMIEIKTMVGSDTLFTAVVEGDHSAYLDQINFALWLLGRKWCDLVLWAPDLPAGQLTVRRIKRDDDAIEALETDLVAFEKLVTKLELSLRRAMGLAEDVKPEPAQATPSPSVAPAELPADIFNT